MKRYLIFFGDGNEPVTANSLAHDPAIQSRILGEWREQVERMASPDSYNRHNFHMHWSIQLDFNQDAGLRLYHRAKALDYARKILFDTDEK